VIKSSAVVDRLARLWHPSLLAPTAVVASSIATQLFGLLSVDLPWLLAGTALLTLAAFLVGRALESGASAEQRVVNLAWTVALLVLVLIGSWLYPSFHRSPGPKYFVVVGSDEAECLRVGAQPGGAPLKLGPQFLCWPAIRG